jgi:hypothetical protein
VNSEHGGASGGRKSNKHAYFSSNKASQSKSSLRMSESSTRTDTGTPTTSTTKPTTMNNDYDRRGRVMTGGSELTRRSSDLGASTVHRMSSSENIGDDVVVDDDDDFGVNEVKGFSRHNSQDSWNMQNPQFNL